MNPVNPDLDSQIRTALAADAHRAPIGTPIWTGPTYPTAATPTQRRNPWMYATLAAAAALIIGAIAITRINHQPEDQAAGFQPPGTEYPLTDLGHPVGRAASLTVANLAHVTQVPDQPAIVSGPTLEYNGGSTVELMFCDASNGGAGCSPKWNASVPNIGITSSVDNRVADFDVLIWSNVPSNAAYVGFSQGEIHLWQRPVQGIVQFPYNWVTRDHTPDANQHVDSSALPYQAIAFDKNGTVVATADDQAIYEAGRLVTDPDPLNADLTMAQSQTIWNLADSTVRGCLSQAGATYSPDGTVAFLADAADDQAVWDGCVADTTAVVASAIAEINPRFYNPSIGERPQVADPAMIFDPPTTG